MREYNYYVCLLHSIHTLEHNYMHVVCDKVISFGRSIPEALVRLEEVLARLSDFGLQLKVKKCTFMQTEVIFPGHIVGRTGLACDPAKLSAVRNWHAPDKVKAIRQFVGFAGYYR